MNLSGFILKIFGWKTVYNVEEPSKSVICLAPHTTNWDFVLGKLCFWSMNKEADFLMKKSWFFFPLGYLLKAMGGIPIDRSQKQSTVKQMVDIFNSSKKLHLAITPEGTRQRNEKWKLGFYYIASGAQVPIQLAYIDYKKKEMGISELFYPSGNEKEDLKHIFDFYRKNYHPKFPERFVIPEI